MHKINPEMSLKYDEQEQEVQCISLVFKFDENQQIFIPNKPKLNASFRNHDSVDDFVEGAQSTSCDACFILAYNYRNQFYNPQCHEQTKYNMRGVLESVFEAGYSLDVDKIKIQAESLIKTIDPEWIVSINKRISDRNKSNDENKEHIVLEDLSDDISKMVEQLCELSEEEFKLNLCHPLTDAQIKAIASDLIKS